MVVTIAMKDGTRPHYHKVIFCGVLGSCKDKIYIQTRARGNVKEILIPLDTIECYNVREPY